MEFVGPVLLLCFSWTSVQYMYKAIEEQSSWAWSIFVVVINGIMICSCHFLVQDMRLCTHIARVGVRFGLTVLSTTNISCLDIFALGWPFLQPLELNTYHGGFISPMFPCTRISKVYRYEKGLQRLAISQFYFEGDCCFWTSHQPHSPMGRAMRWSFGKEDYILNLCLC